MKVQRFVSKVIAVNVLICYDETSKDAVIFDPSGNTKKIFDFISENELNLKAIILTHGHFDHIHAVDKIKDKYNVPIAACDAEVSLLMDANKNYSKVYCGVAMEIDPEIKFLDGDVIEFGTINFKVILTPGHSLGSCCFYNEESKVLITGDTLFLEDVGRTDLDYSAPAKMIPSIKEKLFVLPDDTVVYPGHGDFTTIGHEKVHNRSVI